MSLSEVKVRNARPISKAQRLWDSGGLYLEVSPAGGKLWRLKYRFGGKEKLLALGRWNTVSLAEARERRDDAKKLLARNVDPNVKRREDRRQAEQHAANSFEIVARDWLAKRGHIWVPHHASDVRRRLESNLFPQIGAMPIGKITGPQLLSAVRKIESRGAHDLAHRVLQVASQVFRYGVASGLCDRDPAPDLRGALTPHKARNQAAVKSEDVPALLRAIASYDRDEIGGERQTKLALQLLALTFARTNELIGAHWVEFDVDGEAPTWTVPAERMKMKLPHVVPLARQSVALLRDLRALASNSDYVFPGRNPERPISNNTLLFALYRLGYKGKMTGHGFRAVASSILNETGYRPDVIERQLAHKEPNKVRGAYNKAEYLPERRSMMQAWADLLDEIVAKNHNIVAEESSEELPKASKLMAAACRLDDDPCQP